MFFHIGRYIQQQIDRDFLADMQDCMLAGKDCVINLNILRKKYSSVNRWRKKFNYDNRYFAWVAKRKDDRTYLYIATDSRTRGCMVLDFCPKILLLPRSDCAICFAGDTAATYPLMLQLSDAISSHLPAKERSLDIRTLKPHLLRVFTDIVANIKDASDPIKPRDVQFIFGGYSWLSKTFEIWTIYYSEKDKKFAASLRIIFIQ